MNIEHERTMHTIKNHMYEAKRERNLKPKSPQLATKEEDEMRKPAKRMKNSRSFEWKFKYIHFIFVREKLSWTKINKSSSSSSLVEVVEVSRQCDNMNWKPQHTRAKQSAIRLAASILLVHSSLGINHQCSRHRYSHLSHYIFASWRTNNNEFLWNYFCVFHWHDTAHFSTCTCAELPSVHTVFLWGLHNLFCGWHSWVCCRFSSVHALAGAMHNDSTTTLYLSPAPLPSLSFHIFMNIFILWFRLEIWKLPYTHTLTHKWNTMYVSVACIHALSVVAVASACVPVVTLLPEERALTLTHSFIWTLDSIDAVTHWQVMWYIAIT